MLIYHLLKRWTVLSPITVPGLALSNVDCSGIKGLLSYRELTLRGHMPSTLPQVKVPKTDEFASQPCLHPRHCV